MKKNCIYLLLLLAVSACETSPNNFSAEANEFLQALNGKTYNGLGAYTGSSFTANNTILAQFPDGSGTLKFQNTRNDGASKTEGIYKENRGTQYVGIISKNGGNTLDRTPSASDSNSIDWGNTQPFAQRK